MVRKFKIRYCFVCLTVLVPYQSQWVTPNACPPPAISFSSFICARSQSSFSSRINLDSHCKVPLDSHDNNIQARYRFSIFVAKVIPDLGPLDYPFLGVPLETNFTNFSPDIFHPPV